MLEAPEVEPTLHHKTGHSLPDKILAVLAIFLSCVSVFIAVSHGRTMERLVAANSWPNISYATGNESGDGVNMSRVITFSLKNTGVGPARIDSFELFYKGKAVPDVAALLQACCGKGSDETSSSWVMNEVLPARDSIEFITLPRDNATAAQWDILNKERFSVRVRACYCSVFDECWVRDTEQRRPERTEQCKPSQPVEYR